MNFVVSRNSKQSSAFPLFIKKQGGQKYYEWEIRGKFFQGEDIKKKLKEQPTYCKRIQSLNERHS